MPETRDADLMPPEGQVTAVAKAKAQGFIRPVATEKEVRSAYGEFNKLKGGIFKDVGGLMRIGDKQYVKKEGWVAAKAIFRIDTNVIREAWKTLPDGTMQFICVVHAQAPNGDFAEAIGVCDTAEDFYKKGTRLDQDERVPDGVPTFWVRVAKYVDRRRDGSEWQRFIPKPLSALVGFAQTRAQNRAISTLCGGGENSAEEMTSDPDDPEPLPRESRPSGSGDEVVVPFGRDKGKPLSVVDDKELDYLEDYAKKALADPKKANWRAGNQRLLDGVLAERVARKVGGAPPQDPGPGAAPAPVFGG